MKQKLFALVAAFGVALAALVGLPVTSSPADSGTVHTLVAIAPDGTEVYADLPAGNDPASVARADECTNAFTGLCGKIAVKGSNTIWLYHNEENHSIGGYFRPGTESTDIWKDTDGLVTRPGWCTDVRIIDLNAGGWLFIGTYGQGPLKLVDNYLYWNVWTWDC